MEVFPSAFQDIYSSLVFKTFLVLLVVWFLKWLWSRRNIYVLSYNIPGPLALPILGNALNLGSWGDMIDLTDTLADMQKIYGGFFRIWLGPDFAVVISEPEDYESVLMSKATSWKGDKYMMIQEGLGEGLLTLSGDRWKKHRHIINPAFSLKTSRGYLPIHNKYARLTIESMDKFIHQDLVDVIPFFQRYSADGVCDSLFEMDIQFYKGDKDAVLVNEAESALITHGLMCKMWMSAGWPYRMSKGGQTVLGHYKTYSAFFHPVLRAKADEYLKNKTAADRNTTTDNNFEKEPSYDFDEAVGPKRGKNLSVFVTLMESFIAGEINYDEIVGEFNNVFHGGLDTTYSQLGSFVLLMGMHKDCQEKAWQEVSNTFKDDPDGDVTLENLSKFPYIDMILKETMRIFPTGPIQMRHIHTDFYMKSKNITLPAGTTILMTNMLMHHNPKIWKFPERFMPERFLPEEAAKRPHFSFIPFSAGLRNCIGQIYGSDAIKTLAIHLIKNYEFHSDLTLETLPKAADISYRSAIGYNVKITRRITKNK